MARDRVRRRTDDTFEEEAPPADRSRPLEWRRSFNYVVLTIRKPAVSYLYAVNDRELRFSLRENDDGRNSGPEIKPDTRRCPQIVAKVDGEGFADHIRKAEEAEKGSGVYELISHGQSIDLLLVGKPPSEGDEIYAEGAYPGSAYFDDYKGPERLCVELSAPEPYVQELCAFLERNPGHGLRVCVAISSFSFEVDDFFKEPHHSLDLFIYGMTRAALINIATLAPGSHEDLSAEEERVSPTLSTAASSKNVSAGYLPTPIPKSMVTALWVIAAALVLQWLRNL